MKRNRRILALLAVGAVLVGTELAIRWTFGVWLPWQEPTRIDLCERRYELATFVQQPTVDTHILEVQATLFALPIPVPEVHPPRSRLPYGGCPAQLHLLVGDRVVPYDPGGGP